MPSTTSPEPSVSGRGISRRTLLGGIGAAAAMSGLPAAPAGAATPPSAAGAVGVVVQNESAGRGMPLVGYNTGHYMPGSNTSAWLEYSRVNAVRFFASFTQWAPDEAFDGGAGIESVQDFDARKAQLRSDPERSPFLRWDILEDLFENQVYSDTNHYQLNYQVAELQRLGVAPIMEAVELAWNRPWSGLWLQWQKHYAFTYHLARHYDVERYNFLNEPDHPSAAGDIVDQAVYVRGLQLASDAIRSAIADVNSRYGKSLRAIVQAPVITHASSSKGDDHMDADSDADPRDDEHGWGEISLRNLRTDYHGETVEHDIFDVFDTHQYNKTAPTYEYEIAMMRSKMRMYTPTGVALPIVYSEFNRRNTGAFETSGDDLDTPAIYCDLAGIWAAAAAGQVEGMIAFKFQNTMRANGIPYGTGFYYVANEGRYDIHGVTKAGEVNRLFAKGFKGDAKELLTVAADDGRIVLAAHDREARRCAIWLPHPTGTPAESVTLDLRALPVARRGSEVVVEEVSPTHSGGIVLKAPLPGSGRLTLEQPADSVWLVTVTAPGPIHRVEAHVDAHVRSGGETSGGDMLGVSLPAAGAIGGIGTDGATGAEVSYLAFDLDHPPVEARPPRQAVLELFGSGEDAAPFTFTAYVVIDTAWVGQDLTWETAPYLDPDGVRATEVGTTLFPAGQVSLEGAPGTARLDVTDALRHVDGDAVGFLLIRERRRAEDNADDGRRGEIASVRAEESERRPRLVLSW
ncbi:DNRLRE domain-containing protein [Actinopolymorpha pittospori]|uniref:Uncharacterized protein n=1 Tax=Actinopolymorpha pittospori TaxID=648752 RepID=A0A927MX87_9ACTN|nr:DNRLRE domain-containing protein [Actinopolymorpha pittospori]MBE1608600.1 hypothetical protein [Actinopolymorpha pittospori]